MQKYYNESGQTGSPPKTFPEIMGVPYRHSMYQVPAPYLYRAGCEPIDEVRCQAASRGIEAGPSLPRDHPAFRLDRCERPATTVMVANEPRFGSLDPEEGYIVAHSCCDECREAIQRSDPAFGKFTKIPAG